MRKEVLFLLIGVSSALVSKRFLRYFEEMLMLNFCLAIILISFHRVSYSGKNTVRLPSFAIVSNSSASHFGIMLKCLNLLLFSISSMKNRARSSSGVSLNVAICILSTGNVARHLILCPAYACSANSSQCSYVFGLFFSS